MPGGEEKEKRPGLSRGPEVPRECLVWLGCMVEGGRSRDELQRWVGTIHKLGSLCCSCTGGSPLLTGVPHVRPPLTGVPREPGDQCTCS